MGFHLGIEGGGTKTDFGWLSSDGRSRGELRMGGSSLSRRPAAEVAEVLRAGCAAVWEGAGDGAQACLGVCAGFASAGRQADWYGEALQNLLPRARVRVMTDAELAWQAAAGGGDAIVVIAGTGSIAWGGYGGRQARAGGEGPGRDAGSGDWIGRAAVARGLVAAPEDGDFAGLVPELAALGSPAVEALFCRAGVELAALLLACARELGWAALAAYYAGGVLEHVPQVRAALGASWPHSLAALPRRPIEAALDLAQGLR